jgi:hypothetical protein
VERVRSTSGTNDTVPTLESESEFRLIQSLCQTAASELRAVKLDEAGRAVERIHALAKLIAARYPSRPEAHLALGAAFVQRAKNAWQVDDRGAIERNWKLALHEARQALLLDPQNALARRDVTELQRRLNDLLTPQREPRSQRPSIQSAMKAGL